MPLLRQDGAACDDIKQYWLPPSIHMDDQDQARKPGDKVMRLQELCLGQELCWCCLVEEVRGLYFHFIVTKCSSGLKRKEYFENPSSKRRHWKHFMVVLHLITVLHIVLSCRAARDQIKYFVVVDAAATAAPSQLLPLLRSCIQKCKLKCSPSSETPARHGSTAARRVRCSSSEGN